VIGFVFNNTIGEADFATNDDGSLAVGDPMFTSAVACLFTRGRAAPSDGIVLPAKPQGYWAEQYLAARRGNRPFGSRLWTLGRAKLDATTLALARSFSFEALAWWVPAGKAKRVTTSAVISKLGDNRIDLGVEAIKPDGTRWEHLWTGRLAEL
jgi:phage gp46-like protein